MIRHMPRSLRRILHHTASGATASSSLMPAVGAIVRSISFVSVPQIQVPSHQSTPHPAINSSEIAADLKDWFGSRSDALFDQIHKICSSADENLDETLSSLHLRLSEDFVLRHLRYHRDSEDILPCLVFFDWAGRQPGFHHSRGTYYAIFKILSRAKLLSVLLDWLHKLSSSRFDHSSMNDIAADYHESTGDLPFYRCRFYDTLVMGYAVAGRIDTALQLFGKMRFQGLDLNSFGYHVLLNSLIEEGCFDMVQGLLHQIAARGYESGITTFLKVKNLCLQNRVDEAEDLVRRLAKSGAVVKNLMLIPIIDARFKQGRFDDACALADEFADVDLSSTYTLLISKLVQAGNLDSALVLLKSKRMEGVLPNIVCYNKLIYWLINHNRLEEVYDLLVEMRVEGISPDRRTMNVVVCFFCKSGLTDVAFELYNSRSEIGLSVSSPTYNHLISALCNDGCLDEAYTVMETSLKQGCFPSTITFFILAEKLCAEKKLDKMSQLLDMALKRHIMPSNAVWAKYISALCGDGRVEEAYHLPQVLKKPGLFSKKNVVYNLVRGFVELKRGDMASKLLVQLQTSHRPWKLLKSVIRCLCSVGDWESLRNLLESQLTGDVRSDRRLYDCMIHAAGHALQPDFAVLLFSKMQVSGIMPGLRTKIVLLQGLLKNGKIDQAMSFFLELSGPPAPNIKVYNTMIVGLCKINRPNDALSFWMRTRQMGLVPSVQSYEELVKSLCLSENYQMLAKVFHDYEQTGRPISSFTKGTVLMHSIKNREFMDFWASKMIGDLLKKFIRIVQSKDVKELLEAVENSLEKSIFMHNLLLKLFNKNGRMDYAFAVFKLIQQKGIEPNRYSYDIMLHGFCKEGRAKDAKKWLEEMYRKGFYPSSYNQVLYRRLLEQTPMNM